MDNKFPVPENKEQLCELIKFTNKRRKEIDLDIKELVEEKKFSKNAVGSNPVEPPNMHIISFIISYMEFFNKENSEEKL